MRTTRFSRTLRNTLLASACAFLSVPQAHACSRAVYQGQGGLVMTGRNMDWFQDMHSNLWAFPAGMPRTLNVKGQATTWKSLYGSIVVSSYECGTADGMNEKGLVANLLFLPEAQYGEPDARGKMLVSAWAQYLLDNYATVDEAVNGPDSFQGKDFNMMSVQMEGCPEGTLHLAISDAVGNSAIFEYEQGRLRVYHGMDLPVMTNGPFFHEQLRSYHEWKGLVGDDGYNHLPGTLLSPDRFIRASFFLHEVEQTADPVHGTSVVFSLLDNVGVPRGVKGATYDQDARTHSTIWRAVADQQNRVYYFQDTLGKGLVWVDLKKIDFSPSAGTRKLTLDGHLELSGDQTGHFTPAAPFVFLGSDK